MSGDYNQMWQEYAGKGARKYLDSKYKADNIVGLTGLARECEILRNLDLDKNCELLDVGCASGRQVFSSARYCRRAVGVDVGGNFIDTAKDFAKRNNITNVEFILTDGGRLPFADNSFDRLICSEVIEHVPDHHSFVRDLIRVMKQGAIAVFTVPNWNSRGTLWKRLRNGFRPFPFTPLSDFSAKGIIAHGDAHVRQFSKKEFKEFAESSGLVVLYVGGASFIDGPGIGRLIEFVNRFAFMQWITLRLEYLFARLPFIRPLGRHIVLKVRKR